MEYCAEYGLWIKKGGKIMDTPYEIFETLYWEEPRSVCCVDEINPLKDGDAEIIVVYNLNPNNEQWIKEVCEHYDLIYIKTKEEDYLGQYWKYKIRKGK